MPILFSDDLPPNVSAGPGEGAMDLVATHLRSLVTAALRTRGTILELGVGWYSTPVLNAIAEATRRRIVTLDNNEDWLKQFYPLRSEYHKIELVGFWGDAPLERESYGLVFVDNGQPAEREYLSYRLLDRTDVFVFHDTEEGPAYGYNRVLPKFRYVYTDKAQKAFTSIASNSVDVRKWVKDLSPVEPTREVT